MGEAIIDVTEVLDRQSLTSPFNVRLLLLTFLVTLTYGFECSPSLLLGPEMRPDWDESASQFALDVMRSLAIGCLIPPILGYLADRFGRRPVIVGTAAAYGLVALAAFITLRFVPVSPGQTAAWSRAIAVALGSVLPVLVSLISEFAPRRARASMVLLVLSGIGFGGGLRMLLFSQFMQSYGPRTLLLVGALGPLAVAIMLWKALPESARYLALHPERHDDLADLLRRIDRTCDAGAEARFVMSGEHNKSGFSIAAIFSGRLALLTPLYWIVLFAVLTVFNFMNEMTLPLLASAGVAPEDISIGVAVLQLSAVIGTLFVARFLDKFGYWVVPILVACAIPIVIGIELDTVAAAPLLAAAWSCLLAATFANMATAANVYPTFVRAFALGLGFAVSRFGSGFFWLLDDMDLRFLFHAFRMFELAAVLLGVGLIAAALIVPRYRTLLRDLPVAE
jgi:MFS transporter, AAHS family, 4-hydroxybenzoate transporter